MKEKTRKIIGIVAVLMLLCVACVGAAAADAHVHNNVTFKNAITQSNAASFFNGTLSGTDGTGYLSEDITGIFTVNSIKPVKLCLNGHKIDGNKNGIVITIKEGSSLELYDCSSPSTGTITGGKGEYGAGVHVDKGATFVMYGGTITDCYASADGGGVRNLGTFTLNGGKISNNTGGGTGGGVYSPGKFTMIDGEISGNKTTNTGDYGKGAGVYVSDMAGYSHEFTMTGGKISGNVATVDGGGVYNKGTFTMTGGEISGNEGKSCGGGVYTKGMFIMSGGTISGNKTTSTNYGWGGGVAVDRGGIFTMSSGTIGENTARYGGGVYVGDTEESGMFTMSGGTISGNTAEVDGGGVYTKGVFRMSDGTISNNTGKSVGGGVYVCCMFDMTGGTISGNTTTSTNYGWGGGVAVDRDGDFSMSGGTIGENTARYGGGVYLGDTDDSVNTFSMTGGTISGNTATEENGGNGIYVCYWDVFSKSGSATISDEIIDKAEEGEWEEIKDENDLKDLLKNGGKGRLVNSIYRNDIEYVVKEDCILDLNGKCISQNNNDDRACIEVGTSTQSNKIKFKLIDSKGLAYKDGVYIRKTRDKQSGDAGNGGVRVYKNSTFIFGGGTIWSCSCAGWGNGVYINGNNARFIMSGNALIYDCGNASCNWGGGVFLGKGDFRMSGNAKIQKCCSAQAAGVRVDDNGKFIMNGNAEISNCSTGGGVYNSGTFIMNGGTIHNCTVNGYYCGLVSDGGTNTIIGGLIHDNSPCDTDAFTNYTITYNLNGGTVSSDNIKTYAYRIPYDITLNNPTKGGYTFAGWTGTDLSKPTLTVTIPIGTKKNLEYTANWIKPVTDEKGLRKAVADGGKIILGNHITLSEGELIIEKDVILDLNGYTLAGNGLERVITISSGELTLMDSSKNKTGKINNGYADCGGGVYVSSGTSFIMESGIITGCTAIYGGGVYIADGGYFKITGGEISDCIAEYGNGVYVAESEQESVLSSASGTMTLAASAAPNIIIGTSNNEVVNKSPIEIGGIAVIDEIYLPKYKTIGLLDGKDKLREGAKIGIKVESPDNPGKIFSNPKQVKTFIQNKIIVCKNPGRHFEVDENGKPIIVKDSPEPVTPTSSHSSSVVSFSGEKSGNDFLFKNAVVITKATLPGATSARITNAGTGDGWYKFTLTTEGFAGNGTLYFQVPLDVIEIKKWTVNDVSLFGSTTKYLGTEGQYAKYSASVAKDGTYTIGFEKDAASSAGTVVTPVEPQKTDNCTLTISGVSSMKAGETNVLKVTCSDGHQHVYSWKVNDPTVATIDANGNLNALKAGTVTVTVTDDDGHSATKTITVSPKASAQETPATPVTEKKQTTKSPFPVLGILAGLGAAGVLVMRRKL